MFKATCFVWLARCFPFKKYFSRDSSEEGFPALGRLLARKIALGSEDAIISSVKGKHVNYVIAHYYRITIKMVMQ